MLYEQLHRRYGTHVSERVKRELAASDFNTLSIEDLADWLQKRAEAMHDRYRQLLNNPLARACEDIAVTGTACRQWREAEDLAYLVVIAEDVGAQTRSA